MTTTPQPCVCGNPACLTRIRRKLLPFCRMPAPIPSLELDLRSYSEVAQHRQPGQRIRSITRSGGPKRFALIGSAVLALSGCCIAPSTVRTEVAHLSHIGQHFGGNRTNLGAQYAEVVARWKFKGAYVDVGQGYNLSSGMGPGWKEVCAGGICGPRELTTVAVGFEWRVHP